MTSTKRSALKSAALVAICLTLGALTTIAIAWHYARWRPLAPESYTTHWSHEGSAWLYRRRESPTVTRLDGTRATAWAASNSLIPIIPAPSWSRISTPPDADGPSDYIIDEAFGWPLRSLCCSYVLNTNTGRWGWYSARSAIELRVQHPSERNRFLALPLKPHWPGFLANTLLFALGALPLVLVAWAGFRATLTARSRWRTRRGRCPSCGYQLQTKLDVGCPECGWNRERISNAQSAH